MKKDNEKRVPELRFKGFVGDWEQRKWSDVINISNIMVDPRLAAFKNLPHVGPANIESGTGRLLNNIRTVNEDGLISGKFVFKSDDVIYSKIRPNLRKFAWPKFGGLASADTYVLNSINLDILTQGFIFCTVQTSNFFRYSVSVSMRTGMPKINREDLGLYYFFVPSKSEQNQIAIFWTLLDNILALHERKLALLKKLKTAYLQQLFPENGNTTPRLRFAEFADDWEQRKLGDVVTRLKSYPLSRDVETTKNSGYRYIHYGDIHTRVADVIDNENMLPKIYPGKYETIETGDLCLADASEDYQDIAAPSVLLAEHKDNIVAGLHTIALRPEDTDPLFLYFLFKAPAFRHYVYREGQGLKVFGISARSILNYTYVFPSITEQAKIVKLLRDFDTTIALHQRKLESVRELKQAYLQKLFV